MQGPEAYPHPHTGGRNIGRNHDFNPFGGGNHDFTRFRGGPSGNRGGHRPGQTNMNESEIHVSNENGRLQVWNNGELVSGGMDGGEPGAGGGSLAVFNDNGRLQIFRNGQPLDIHGGGGGCLSGRYGGGSRRRGPRGMPPGISGAFGSWGFDGGNMPPWMFRYSGSDFSDDDMDFGGRGPRRSRGSRSTHGAGGLAPGEDPFSGQRGPGPRQGAVSGGNMHGGEDLGEDDDDEQGYDNDDVAAGYHSGDDYEDAQDWLARNGRSAPCRERRRN